MFPCPPAIAETLICPPNSQPWLMKLFSACSLGKTKIRRFLLTPKSIFHPCAEPQQCCCPLSPSLNPATRWPRSPQAGLSPFWVQDFSSYFWSEDEINIRQERIMSEAFESIRQLATKCQLSLRTAAFVVGCSRVLQARAMWPVSLSTR